ncbi:P-loop containing nucleoside triphosphate hydrolase protein, partial [Mycena filopes]
EQVLNILRDHPDLRSSTSETTSNRAVSIYGARLLSPLVHLCSLSHTSQCSSESLPLLPARPQIFHGRETEVTNIVDCLVAGPACIAILGPGGVGKTALALAVIHHPQTSAVYEHVYFISCQSCATCSDLTANIVSHLPLERTGNPRSIIQHLSYNPVPVLFVLDNLETTWEEQHSRSDVEDLLSLLTEVPKLTLMITMRGAERPGKVQWSRPFLQALSPLKASATLEMFHEIAGEDHDPASIHELLQLTGNLPLAVSLMANVVASEGCGPTLSRWVKENTSLLSNGYDQTSSLDISIMLSCTSPRMTPGALELLSVLAMLPDGLSHAFMVQSDFDIPNILSCKATLIQISLAYVDHHRCLQILPPIREYTRKTYPVKAKLITNLCQHFYALLST